MVGEWLSGPMGPSMPSMLHPERSGEGCSSSSLPPAKVRGIGGADVGKGHGNGQEAAELLLNVEAQCQLHV